MEICDKKLCTGCGACCQICPVNAITMVEDENGFLHPQTDESKCIKCGLCVKRCHINNNFKKNEEAKIFMGWHKKKEILKKSSSGGAFTAIADFILNKNGVVFGAYYNKIKNTVYHIKINNQKDLEKLRLSKYFQSEIGSIYKDVLEELKNDRYVLFSGTACQIAGLKSFLNKDYEKLYTVDVLCHGVSSKKVVDAYKKSKEKKYKKEIDSLIFRIKPDDSDWENGKGTNMKLKFKDNSQIIQPSYLDTYFKAFNSNLILRDSCYNCKYCGVSRISDYTIADYWGVTLEEVEQEQMKYGVSLILFNSNKAKESKKIIEKEMFIKPANKKQAIENNLAFTKPNTMNKNRDIFFEKLNKGEDFDRIVHQIYYKFYFKSKIKRIIIKLIGEKNFLKILNSIKR